MLAYLCADLRAVHEGIWQPAQEMQLVMAGWMIKVLFMVIDGRRCEAQQEATVTMQP